MKKIVSVIRPFTLNQNVFVYEDGNKIDIVNTDFENLSDVLLDTAIKYEITDIQLIGAKNFSMGIKDKIEKAEMTKYSTHNIIVTLVNS